MSSTLASSHNLKPLLVILLVLIGSSIYAQELEEDHLLSEMLFTTTELRQTAINAFLEYFPKDSAGEVQAYKIIGSYGKTHGDLNLEMCEPIAYLRVLERSKYVSNTSLKGAIDSVYAVARERKMEDVHLAGFERKLGGYYMGREKNYALAFKHYQKGVELLRAVDVSEHPYKVQEILALVYRHYDFEDFEQTIYYAKEALKEDKKIKNRNLAGVLRMFAAYGFRDLGQLDSADVYFDQVIGEAHERGDKVQEGTAKCYLGYNRYLKNDLKEAEKLFLEGIKLIGDDDGMKPVKVLFTSYLADVNRQKGYLEKAKSYLNELNSLGVNLAYRGNQAKVYRNISRVYKELGDSQLALAYLDSLEAADEYMKVTYDSKRFLRVKQQEEIDRIEYEKSNIVFWRNVSLYFLSFAFLVSLTVYWIRNKKKQREIERIQQELEHSKAELSHITQHFKNRGHLQATSVDDNDQNLTLQILEESTILTKEEWETFKYHFEKVHPGLLKNLVKKYPDLTQGELRFLSLKKLGLSNKDMAETLGVSDQSIRTTLHRLRKKVNLSSDEDIDVILGSVGPLT